MVCSVTDSGTVGSGGGINMLSRKSTRRWALFWLVVVAIVVAAIATAVAVGPQDRNKAGDAPNPAPTTSPTVVSQEVIDAVVPHSGLEAVSQEGTPQRRAAGWMSTQDQLDPEGFGPRFLQRYGTLLDVCLRVASRTFLTLLVFPSIGGFVLWHRWTILG